MTKESRPHNAQLLSEHKDDDGKIYQVDANPNPKEAYELTATLIVTRVLGWYKSDCAIRTSKHFVRFKNSSEFHTLLELDTLCATQERNNPDLKVIALNKKLNRDNQEELSFLLVENINPVSRKLFMIKYNVQMNKTSDRILLYQ